MEPDHANETPRHDFTVAAVAGTVCDGTCGLDDLGQELLAERDQAKRTSHNDRLTDRCECFACLRPRRVQHATGRRSERGGIGLALSGRP
jgi:hypothetical protein